jgi:hypothetical protein
MSRNPYAHPEPEETGILPSGPQRTSVMAVLSLVSSLVCCLPGTGAVGVCLGVGALVGISGSQGRVGGRGLAFTGLLLGVLTTVVQLALLVGISSTLSRLDGWGRVIEAVQQSDRDAARVMLVQAPISDARLDAFSREVTDEWGAYRSMPRGLRGYIRGYVDIGGGGPAMIEAQKRYAEPFPMPVLFDRGTTTLVVVLADDVHDKAPNGLTRLKDIGVLSRSGKIVWLRESTPAPPSSP